MLVASFSNTSYSEEHSTRTLIDSKASKVMVNSTYHPPHIHHMISARLFEIASDPQGALFESFWHANEAAMAGHREAMATVAKMHFLGIGTPENKDKALLWTSKLDDHTQDIRLIKSYSRIFLNGDENFNPDILSAIHWLEKGVELNDLESTVKLAEIYEGKYGWMKSPKVSYALRLLASNLGHIESKFFIANHALTMGNYKFAKSKYQELEASGENQATFELAQMQRHGLGEPADKIQAYLTFTRASSNGHIGASKVREELVSNFTIDEQVLARKAQQAVIERQVDSL